MYPRIDICGYPQSFADTDRIGIQTVSSPSTSCYAASLRAKVFYLSFEYLHSYFIAQKVTIFAGKKIAKLYHSLMSCHMSDLRKTLTYSQNLDLEGIQ